MKKTMCEACKGKAGNRACKACRGAGYVAKMGDHDKDYDMKKASEILKGLRDILPEDEAQRIVKSKIKDGGCIDDLGVAGLDVDALDAAVDAMKASLEGDYCAETSGADLVKARAGIEGIMDYDGSVEFAAMFTHLSDTNADVAKGLNALGYESRASTEVITKGVMAVAVMLRDAAEVIKGQAAELHEIRVRQDQISVAMGQPVPPRSILTGATPIPAPFEQGGVVKAGVAASGDEGGASAPPFTALDVFKAATDEMNEITANGPVMEVGKRNRLGDLAKAISLCEAGQPGPEIAAQFKIAVSA